MTSIIWQDVLDNLDLADLQDLRAAIDTLITERLAELGETREPNGEDTAPNSEGDTPTGRKAGRHWVELKMIRGYGPYAYERWFEGGHKRSRYAGKVAEDGA